MQANVTAGGPRNALTMQRERREHAGSQREGERTAPLALPRRSWRPGNLAELRVLGPTEFPQVRAYGVVPHRIPTDETAFPGTRRHGC